MEHIYHYSRFFGVRKWTVVSDLGEHLVVSLGTVVQTVLKANVDRDNTDGISDWWSSMDKWADSKVTAAERWAAELQSRVDGLDAEIATLRKERETEAAHGQIELEEAREWRKTFRFEDEVLNAAS